MPLKLTDELELPYRICAIDPGTDTLGVAIIDLYLTRRIMRVVEVRTYKASDRYASVAHLNQSLSDRGLRMYWHGINLTNVLFAWLPNAVIAEAPYMGRFPAAYEALVECRSMIRQSVASYNPALELLLVDPPSAKKSVGAIVKKGSKENVQESVLKLPFLEWYQPLGIDAIDEHGFDAIAVGVHHGLEVLIQYG
jgi:hypothetical protein